MKYLIISTYDSGYWWEIKTNDCSLDRNEYEDNKYIEGLEILCNRLDEDLLDMVSDEIPFDDFDFVVLSVDGSIEVLKDTTNK